MMPLRSQDVRDAADAETEMHLLGYLFEDPKRVDAVRDRVTAAHFCDPTLGWLYATMLDWFAAGKPLTMPALAKHYGEAIADSGLGASLIERLNSPLFRLTSRGFADTAESVFQSGSVRLMQAAIGKLAVTPFETTRGLTMELDHLTSAQMGGGDDASYSRTAGAAADDVIQQALAARRGESVGLKSRLLSSLPSMGPSDLILLAARPSMGKSALATNIVRSVAEDGIGVVLFSLEMSADQQVRRMVAEMTRDTSGPITHDMIREGRLTDADIEMMQYCQKKLADFPLYFHDRGGMTMAQIRHWTRIYAGLCEARGTPLGLVVVDYLQLVDNPKTQGNRVSDITIVSKGLKNMAKELKIPVLALSQLSRALESRDDKRPMLSDLRDSGALEQDADSVLMLYREEYYLSRTKPKAGKEVEHADRLWALRGLAEVHVAKNRHSVVETINLDWDGPHQAFRERARG